MPDWVVTILSLVGSTIITTIIGVIVKHTVSKEFDRQKELTILREEKAKEERKKELTQDLVLHLKPLEDKLDAVNSQLEKVTEGTLSSLRNDILTCYYRCREKGYRNDYDYQNIHDLFAAYEILDGNSFIKDVMNRFDRLPIKEDVKDIDAHMGVRKNRQILNED